MPGKIRDALPEAVSVYGSQDLEERERNVIAFSDGEIQFLATKPELSGSGCNFQRYCHRAIFMGIDYEFNDVIQAIHRVYRFLQKKPVIIAFMGGDREEIEACGAIYAETTKRAALKAVILSEGDRLHAGDFYLRKSSASPTLADKMTLEQAEKLLIQHALRRNKDNLSAVAAELGITRPTLYNKIRKYQL